jgi:hypothetical protein
MTTLQFEEVGNDKSVCNALRKLAYFAPNLLKKGPFRVPLTI